jgi:hypothetical protein
LASAGQGGGRGECIRVHRYNISKQPGDSVARPGNRMRRMCTETAVHREQTVRECGVRAVARGVMTAVDTLLAQTYGAGSGRLTLCPPRHPHAFEPSFRESNGIT